MPPALVAAVIEAADDAAARFVLADWLSERGDPHGPWLMEWLATDERAPRAFVDPSTVHRTLFAGWPRQHAVVTWRMGFVRELVVRVPGVSRDHVSAVLRHPTLWLVESVTFAAACLPLFEQGAFDEMVGALAASGPHARLVRLHFAGQRVDPVQLAATGDRLRTVAPRLASVTAGPAIDPQTLEWFDRLDRLDGSTEGVPGPFSPAPAAPPLDRADEERLWLEHTDLCDVFDDEMDGW